MSISKNIEIIEERIQKACEKSGRKRDEITLMAVSKFVPIDGIKEAYNAGIRCFGESRVKEATEKLAGFNESFPNSQLHMIGSLQRNKAKTAALFFDCIQSVDRDELIDELAKHTEQRPCPLNVLLELHTGEASKSGYSDLDGLFFAAEKILALGQNLKLQGLMTMAPYFEDMSQPEAIQQVRGSFRQLVNAQKELEKRFPSGENAGWNCLSMGMSNDFEIAIEEGATLLRIGSLIFRD